MRAKSRIFHQDCFRCRICEKPLVPGEEFALRGDGTLFCKVHNHEETAEATTNGQLKLEELNNNNDIIEEAEMMDEDSVDSFASVPGGGGDGPDSKSKSLKDEKGMFQGEDIVGLLDLLTSATRANHEHMHSLTQTQKPYFVNYVIITS